VVGHGDQLPVTVSRRDFASEVGRPLHRSVPDAGAMLATPSASATTETSTKTIRPIRCQPSQIAENSGVEGSIVVGNVLANKSQTFGFDAQTEQYVDMLSAGIVDPAKVVRVA